MMQSAGDYAKNHCVECGISSSEVSVPVDHTESVQLREYIHESTSREMI